VTAPTLVAVVANTEAAKWINRLRLTSAQTIAGGHRALIYSPVGGQGPLIEYR
jgi:hypothetical protein